MPRAVIIAGANGAGKSTFAPELLSQGTRIGHFLNTDLIAAGLSPLAPSPADVEAGRLMIQRLDHVVSQGEDFAIETTLSGTWLAKRIPRWRELGYRAELYYLWLSDPEIAVERVRRRVVQGGHDVPEADVRRRFVRSRRLFESTYRELVDVWVVYDVSGSTPAQKARQAACTEGEQKELAEEGLRALRRATEKALRRQVVTLEDLEDATRRMEAAGFGVSGSSPVMTEGVVLSDDPNLALAALRIEFERRPRNGSGNEPRILDLIYEGGRFTEPQSSALVHLLTLLNSAVHGADVTKDAPGWVERTGFRIVSAIGQ